MGKEAHATSFFEWARCHQYFPRLRLLTVHVDDEGQFVEVGVRRYVPSRMNWAYSWYRFSPQFGRAFHWRSILSLKIRELRREVRSVQ